MCGLLLIAASQVNNHHLLGHRGPDDTSVSRFDRYALVHKRLSIVDVQNGTQPYNDNGDLTIFNGEIFNCPKVKTEVNYLAELLRDDHPNLHSVLNGYYAIIQVRKNRKEVRAFRDPFGVMPLYYTRSPFSIASERQALDSFADKQFEVPPGGCLTFNIKTGKIKVATRSLYDTFHVSSTPPKIYHSIDLMQKAVRRTAKHSESGFSLAFSGGLDSSIILRCLMKEELVPKEIITVNSTSDEMDRARNFIHDHEMSYLWKVVEPKEVSALALERMLPGRRNPIRDFAFTRHLAVAKATSTKVILCGEGADELDFGYINTAKERAEFDKLSQPERLKKKFALLHGMARFSLDRVNLAGMRYSKEYRVPFLDMDFANSMLSVPLLPGKEWLRIMAKHLGLPDYIVNASKFSAAETEGRELMRITAETTA